MAGLKCEIAARDWPIDRSAYTKTQANMSVTTQRCFYTLDSEFVLLTWDLQLDGWIPANESVITNHMNLYRPFADMIITSDNQQNLTGWVEIERESIAEIRMLPARPWLPLEDAIQATLSEIPVMDRRRRGTEPTPVEPLLDNAPNEWAGGSLVSATVLYSPPMEDIPNLFHPLFYPPQPSALTLLSNLLHDTYRDPLPSKPVQKGPPPMPKHVAEILLAKAETDGSTCSISMEAITRTNGTVTSCGHLFEREAIRTWLTSHDTCPECRQSCSIPTA